MKKLMILCLLLTGMSVQAQGIKDGSRWNWEELDYTAKVNDDHTIAFTSMAEGEELGFMLNPCDGKQNEYDLDDITDFDGLNPFDEPLHVKYVVQQGWKLLCFYNEKGLLQAILDGTQTADGESVARNKWTQQLMGHYIDSYGDTLQIGREIIYDKGVARAEYTHVMFNGCVIGVIIVKGLTDLEGAWEAVQTLDGLTLYQVEPGEYGQYSRAGGKKQLKWVNTAPRFGYTQDLLLNDTRFRWLSRPTLRIMRNEILARHGYNFSSPDLAAYFGKQPWYRPRPTNDGILDELGFIERLNIELIKAEEAKSDETRYVKE